MTYKASALFILTIALSTNSHAKKDDYAACMKKAQKQFIACTKENKKREKKKENAINCQAIQDLAQKLCEEQHPINHTTFDSKRFSQASSSDTASTSSQQSSTAPSSDSSPRSNEPTWTQNDDNILATHFMTADGFIENVQSRKECKDKIHNMVSNIKNTPNSNDIPRDLVLALNKLCTIKFPQDYRRSQMLSPHSFETPSVLGNLNKASSSTSTTPEDGSISQSPLKNPALD